MTCIIALQRIQTSRISQRGNCPMANARTEPEDKRPVQKGPARKPYTKPSFRFERVFETLALTCGKRSPTEFLCRHNRKAS